jgi:hypothetical protein
MRDAAKAFDCRLSHWCRAYVATIEVINRTAVVGCAATVTSNR